MLNHDTALFYFFRVKIRRKCLRHRRKKVPDVFVAHIISDLDRVVRLLLDRHSCLCLPAGAHCCGVAQGHHKASWEPGDCWAKVITAENIPPLKVLGGAPWPFLRESMSHQRLRARSMKMGNTHFAVAL
jgi:hypothetical protein